MTPDTRASAADTPGTAGGPRTGREDVEPALWAKWTAGEKLAYGVGHRRGQAAAAKAERERLLGELAELGARWEQTIATIEYEGEDDPALAKTTRIQATSRRACLDDLRSLLGRLGESQ